MDPRLKKLLIHTIRIKPFVGVNADGEEQFGEWEEHKCRIEDARQYIRSEGGDIIESRSQIFMDLTPVDSRSIVVLPDRIERQIFRVVTVPGRIKDDHTVLMV